MAEGDVDQFYRRQGMYPVTEYGLGHPYSVEDGMLEGDSAAPTVYQIAGAVRTACGTVEGAVRFLGPGGAVSLSEFVFNDDRRLLHHKKSLFEELVEERVRTTKAAGCLRRSCCLGWSGAAPTGRCIFRGIWCLPCLCSKLQSRTFPVSFSVVCPRASPQWIHLILSAWVTRA